MRKFNLRVLISLLAVMLCMAAFSVTAFADGGDYYDDEIPLETPAVTEQPVEEPVETEAPAEKTPEPAEDAPEDTAPEVTGGIDTPFTPDGNLSLIDDFSYTGVDADGNPVGKQFITVQSKTGNYFFIVIDRAGDKENVYFLNMVDEADLLALIDEPESEPEPTPAVCACKDKCYAGHVDTACPVCATDMTKCTGKEVKPDPVEPTEDPQPEAPEKKSAGNPALVIVLLLAMGGGAAWYFLKVKGKAKPKTKGDTDLDDYDYGAEDGEYEFEPYDPEAEGGGAPGDSEDDGA